MAAASNGTTQNLSKSRTEVLQALFDSISPQDTQNGSPMSKDQIVKISDKLGEMLEDAGGATGDAQNGVNRNERGEILNEEGLPIIEISEPIIQTEETTVPDPPPLEDPGLVPLATMSSEEREFTRRRMNDILNLLEEEEALEEERNAESERERAKEELERRKSNARKELERLHAAKVMQKRMGKALLRNLADTREREEREKQMQLLEDMEKEEERKAGRPKKSVAFADIPPEASSASPIASSSKLRSPDIPGSDAVGKFRPSDVGQPMKFQVVERFPSIHLPTPTPTSAPEGDSDDETDPGSPVPADSDDGDVILSDHDLDAIPEVRPDQNGEDEEDDIPDDPVEEDEFDLNTAQHHREIALAYYEKRGTLGQDAARAMAAHSHEPFENEWDQPNVPLEATLSSPAPKPPTSKFKSSRLSQAYNTTVPSSTPSTSLGASILPGNASTIKGAVRLGWVEDDKLVGAGESDEDDEDENIEAFMAALRKGEITNAGAEQNAEVLVAALTRAYGGPSPMAAPSTSTQSAPLVEPKSSDLSSVQPPSKPKTSKFKLTRPQARSSPSDSSGSGTPLSTVGRSSPKLPTSQTVVERKPGPSLLAARPAVQTTIPKCASSSVKNASPSSTSTTVNTPSTVVDSPSFLQPVSQTPSMVVDSPSFRPHVSQIPLQMPSMIVDSPSFQPPTSNRPSRPPMVMSSTVRESTGGRPAHALDAEPRKVSRFKAQRS
ncbi:hypothetical protein OF83DRAFT_1165618 [Amylostereum chailletii]|nr:hypothetical protein OF83DRAFT_1165618 [Amylostereum chailletii]